MYNPYEIMYDATMDVTRWEEVEIDGFTEHRELPVVAGVKCRYSSDGQVAVGSPMPSIVTGHTLFCGIDTPIKEGDIVTVHLKMGKTLKLNVGECHPYTFQWQCRVTREDSA